MQRRHLLALAAVLPAACATVPPAPRDWFIFLETGETKLPDDKARVAAMQQGHIDNFKRLHGLGLLQAAGPLRDPGRLKRGIVLARAASREELQSYFQPDEYVREGYMKVNAAPAQARKPLNNAPVDPNAIEEARIILIGREGDAAQRQTILQAHVDSGKLGAWYSLESGPISEVLFARGTDTEGLTRLLAGQPLIGVWSQWIAKGVIG